MGESVFWGILVSGSCKRVASSHELKSEYSVRRMGLSEN